MGDGRTDDGEGGIPYEGADPVHLCSYTPFHQTVGAYTPVLGPGPDVWVAEW